MFIIIEGIEPQYKIYKMSESVEGKIYIGKTKRPLRERMNGHRNSRQYSDKHFSDVGWNNVTVEIIDTANDDNELTMKENMRINEYYNKYKMLLLNRNNFYSATPFNKIQNKSFKKEKEEETEPVYFSEIDIFPDNHWFSCQRKIDEYNHDVFKLIKDNNYIIKNVCGARKYISICILRLSKRQITNQEARRQIIDFLKDKPWKGKCEKNISWRK